MKSALDEIIQVHLKQPDLEFIWVGDDAIDPLQQAQTLSILVNAGIKTREEARAELGLAPEPGVKPIAGIGVGKYNHIHDERGRFATAEGAGVAGKNPKRPAARNSSEAARPHDSKGADARGGRSGGGYEKCPLIPADYGFCLYSCPTGGVRRLDKGRLGRQLWIFGHQGPGPDA